MCGTNGKENGANGKNGNTNGTNVTSQWYHWENPGHTHFLNGISICDDAFVPTAYEPHHKKTNNVVSLQVRHKSTVRAQKMSRGWKFWIYKAEELYYPCSENKGVDQLRSNCEADLRLCFRICKLLVFS